MSIRKGILGVFTALSALTLIHTGAHTTALAANVDILRAIPLEIKDYPMAKSFPARFSSPAQVINILDGTPNLLLHMEALRRAYHDMPMDQHEALLKAIHARRMRNENDLMLGFDHGYAQLVFKENKTGLFFLRKANDKFKDQFSSLAYGMAEAQADLNIEGAAPEEMTTRKLDVTFQLSDAVKRDAENHQPGFWPSYVRVIEKLKPIGAYNSFTKRDFSLTYIPYGNSVVPMRGASTVSIPLKTDKPGTLLTNAAYTSCGATSPADDATAGGAAIKQRPAQFGSSSALIQFFNTDESGLYRVRVLSSDGRPMLSFKTFAMSQIVEDLEGDGIYEIVARQYKQDPMRPVLVYRYTPCGFELDKKVFEAFQ